MKTHLDLDAWKLGVDLARLVYRSTASFPPEERFGLTSQMRRAAVSVPSNIAEGAARQTARDFRRFLFMARGSLAELETLIVIATDVGILGPENRDQLVDSHARAARTLQGLIRSIDA